MRHGGQAYLNLGKPNNGGTKLFSVSGHVNRPGNYESPWAPPSPNCWKWPAACVKATS
jgi:NADH-quinone oxidoreductase subunit F